MMRWNSLSVSGVGVLSFRMATMAALALVGGGAGLGVNAEAGLPIGARIGGMHHATAEFGQIVIGAQPMPADGGSTGSGLFPTDRTQTRRLALARDFIEQQNYTRGLQALQAVLDEPKDSFFRPDPERPGNHRSVKVEAQRLISELPQEGRDLYELQYGSIAQGLLERAETDGDFARVAEVVRRFYHTKAGFTATMALATEHLDHGRALAAALLLDRVTKNHIHVRSPDPTLLLKGALAWLRAGMPSQAEETLVRLQGLAVNGKITIANHKLDIFTDRTKAIAWLQKSLGGAASGIQVGLDDWLIPRGASSRNGSSVGKAPYLNEGWSQSLVEGSGSDEAQDKKLKEYFTGPYTDFRQRGDHLTVAAVPSGQPLAVGGLVIARSYGDIRAYDTDSGQLAWASYDKDTHLTSTLSNRSSEVRNVNTGLAVSTTSLLLTQRAWKDNTWGTLTSDGERVFAVEDLSVLPINMNAFMRPNPSSERAKNRLSAYEVKTGKLVWELPHGGPNDVADNTFFLGPPLPLGQELYAIAEANSEFQLVGMNRRTGRVVWSQVLAASDAVGQPDLTRRTSGLSPSYSSGVLVCPTDSGAIVAVDLATRELLWARRYANDTQGNGRNRFGFGIVNSQMSRGRGQIGNEPTSWIDSLAVIAESYVLITPRDQQKLLCLNLLDGDLVWEKERKNGLYLAGVHNGNAVVVGTGGMEAFSLAKGDPVWSEPPTLPMPSGRGLLNGDFYYLPLATAEVAKVDLRSGMLVGRTMARNGQAPGNLIGVRDRILSQTVESLEGYRHLDMLEPELLAKLETHPDDPRALALRGEILMQRGKLAEAFDDLRKASNQKIEDAQLRRILVESLLEGLRIDFPRFREASQQIATLVETPKHRSSFLRLQGAGFEKAGDVRNAFDTYLTFTDPKVSHLELEQIESQWALRRDRYVETRLAGLYKKANDAEKKGMDALLEERLSQAIEHKNPEELRRFLSFFGTRPLADRARAVLIEQLTPTGELLEQERWLSELALSSDTAAALRAKLQHTQLLLDAKQPAHAAIVLGKVGAEIPPDLKLGERSATDVARTLRENAELKQADNVSWPVGKVIVAKNATNPTAVQRAIRIPTEGNLGDFYRDSSFEVDSRGQILVAKGRDGNTLWKFNNPELARNYGNVYLNRVHAHGHIVVFTIGTNVAAVDTLGTKDNPGPRLLWKTSLIEDVGGANPNSVGISMRQIRMNNGVPKYVAYDQTGQPIGSVGHVTSEFVVMQKGKRLYAVDLLTGKTLWMREGTTPGSEMFGTSEHLFVMGTDEINARMINARDGALLGTRRLADANNRVLMDDRFVVMRVEGDNGGLACRDVVDDVEVWKHEAKGAFQYAVLPSREIACIGIDGKLAILNTRTGKTRFTDQLDAIPDLTGLMVISGAGTDTVLVGRTGKADPKVQVQQFGVYGRPFAGNALGYDSATGKRLWNIEIDKHAIDLTHPGQSPILFFTGMFLTQPVAGRGFTNQLGVKAIHRATGEVLFDERFTNENYQTDILIDAVKKNVELKLYRTILAFKFPETPAK